MNQGYNEVENTVEVSSIAGLMSALHETPTSRTIWYRGQSNEEWSLLPGLARQENGLGRESDFIARFKQNASLLLPSLPRNDWEWLTIMQHYRVPTRLLDWSESPLVALYFAVVPHSHSDGALWVLNPTALNRVSNIDPDYENYIPNLEDENILNNYLPGVIQSERTSRLQPIAIIGPRNTQRMQAQLGVFTIMHREPIPVEQVGSGGHMRKLIVPHGAKHELRRELTLLAIDKFQLFPDLQSLGDILRGESDD